MTSTRFPADRVRRLALWVSADVVLVIVFAVLGHLSHYASISPAGIAGTAAPFLVAYLLSFILCFAWRRPAALIRTGVPLWVGTAAGGLLLRVLFGTSAALAFQIVSVVVLGLFLLTPRLLTGLFSKYRRRSSRHPNPSSPSPRQGVAR